MKLAELLLSSEGAGGFLGQGRTASRGGNVYVPQRSGDKAWQTAAVLRMNANLPGVEDGVNSL